MTTFRKGLGLKTPDPHPLELAKAKVRGVPETLSFNYIDMFGPVEDQGETGDCWVFSVAGMFEAYHFRRTKQRLVVSKRGLWYLAKENYESNDMEDDGGYPSDTVRTLQTVGYVLESDWPDTDSDTDQRIPVPADLIKTDFKADGLLAVDTSADAVISAGHQHGPVAICVNWPNEWYNASPLAPTGLLVNLNDPSDAVGGHAIVALGHFPAGSLFPNSPAATLIRNSWSSSWPGVGGRAPGGYAIVRDVDLGAILIDGNCCMEIPSEA
jgi:C1A family cysteine protease